jgi:hypothetical protein
VEAYRDASGQLMTAIEKTAEYAAGAAEPEEVHEASVDAQNEQSLQQLQQMMRGIGR